MEILDFWTAFVIGFLLYLVYLLPKCRFSVQEGHIAVSTIFGKAIRFSESSPQLKSFGPGFHLKWPWQKIQEVSLMEQMIELSGEEGGTTAMASDGTMLRLDSKLRFTPIKRDLYNFLFSIEKPIEHMKGLFICLLRNEIANFDHQQQEQKENPSVLSPIQVGSYAALRRERKMLNNKIQSFCKQQIGDRYGIRFDGVDLTDILPPDELAHALNGVINAQSEANKLNAQTECECQQRLLAAQKNFNIAQAKARAAEEEINTMTRLLSNLQENGTLALYVERRRAEVFAESRTSFIKRPL